MIGYRLELAAGCKWRPASALLARLWRAGKAEG